MSPCSGARGAPLYLDVVQERRHASRHVHDKGEIRDDVAQVDLSERALYAGAELIEARNLLHELTVGRRQHTGRVLLVVADDRRGLNVLNSVRCLARIQQKTESIGKVTWQPGGHPYGEYSGHKQLVVAHAHTDYLNVGGSCRGERSRHSLACGTCGSQQSATALPHGARSLP